MSSKIINFQNNPERSTVTAFWLSFLFPGAGQLYNRSITKALAFFFVRIIPILLIPLFIYSDSVNISQVLFFTVLFLLLLPFFSALESFLDAKKNIMHPTNHTSAITTFIVLSVLFTIIASASIPKYFSLKIIIDNSDSPHLMKNDVILIIKNSPKSVNINDLVVIDKDDPNYYRVISANRSRVQVVTDVIIVNGSGLIRGLLSEKENKLFSNSLDRDSIVTELNLKYRYAIASSNILDFDEKFDLNDNEFFLAKDNRTGSDPFKVVTQEEIFGKVDSVIFSLSLSRFFLTPKLDNL